MSYDPWDGVGDSDQSERSTSEFASLPSKQYLLVKTTTSQNGKAAPEVKSYQIKKGDRAGETFYKFKTGLICIGGEREVPEKCKGKYAWFDAFVSPSDKEPGAVVSGRMAAFLNACFSAGVGNDLTEGLSGAALKEAQHERAKTRWRATTKKIKDLTETYIPSVDYGSYKNDDGTLNTGRMIAGISATLLKDYCEGRLIIKLGDRKNQKGEMEQYIVSFEEATTENIEKYGLTEWMDEEDLPF